MPPTFGITFERDDNDPRAVIASDMSTIGVVGTAPDADEDLFPLDTAVLVRTSDTVLRAALGSTGSIADSLRGVGDQLGDFQAAAEVIVVRVEEGANDAETMANIIGSEAEMTGLWALLLAGPDLGKIPRLIGAPGFTHQLVTGIKRTAAAITPGSGGTNGTFALAFTGGTGSGAAGTFTVTGGALTAVTITEGGSYTVAPTLSFAASSGLTGAAAPVELTQAANPVCAALPPIASRLLAHAVVEGPGTNEAAIKAWRETINSERLIPIDLWVKVLEGTSIVTRPGAPRVLGLMASVDYEHGGAPMHSAANRPIQGIVGLVRNPSFSLTDDANEGQSLLAANIGIAVRGELGVESAISSSGFLFIGTDNAGDDQLWQFYNVTRGRDYIHLGLLSTLRRYLGRNNVTGHTVQSILNTAGGWLGQLQADQHILGYRVGFDEDQNTPEDIRLGKFSFFFQAEEPPVLRQLHVSSRRYRPALEAMVRDLLASTQPAVAA